MLSELDEILRKVRYREMRTFEARVRILNLFEREQESACECSDDD